MHLTAQMHVPSDPNVRIAFAPLGMVSLKAPTVVVRWLNDSTILALDTLVREELGIDPEELGGSAWAAAASSFLLFSTGAIFPVAAFLFTSGDLAVEISVAVSGLALMAIGWVTSLFTGRKPVFSAVRQLLIGYAAAAITFGVGRLIGVSLS